MPCAQCRTELLPGRKFCHACGAAAASACPSCGLRVEAGWRFCPDCGHVLGDAPSTTPPATVSPDDPQRIETLVAPDERLAQLARHIPETLAKRIRAAGAVAGERKRATVFFCDLVGSTAIAEGLDPEVYRELLDRYLELVFAEIYRFEGIVNQLAGDGLMALFGAPIAHEDAPERAVRAALAIQSALDELSTRLIEEGAVALHARIGIHTGIVVAGTVGNDFKMDYTAIGDTTNLAARLQALAEPGTIVISDATYALLRGAFRTAPLGPFEVKGKSEPVTAHQVLGVAERVTAFAGELTPYVGRDAELSQLEACFDRLDTGLAQVVSVVGDAGIGKSRLVHEFKKRLAGQEFELLEARCSSLTRSVPYAPWVAMLKRWLDVDDGEVEQTACAKVLQRFDREGIALDQTYTDLCWMMSLTPDEEEPSAEEPARHRGFEAVSRLIERTSARVPVVMIIEDLHWLDDASREVLEMAVARTDTASVMIVTTHRPDHKPNWRSNAAFTQLRLRPLGDADATRIVHARAGGIVPRDVDERILRKADGNPFYLEELTRTLVEDGTLVARDGRVVVTRRSDEIRIPDTIGEVLGARIDRLRPAAKRVAQVASVLGRQFRLRYVQALLENESIDVVAELGELERRGVLHRIGGMSEDEYRFGESLTQEVAYEGLLLRERRLLHDRIALVLEAESGDVTLGGDTRGSLALAAHHLARGDDRVRGIGALLAAAREAQAIPSYGDAVRLYREAWRLAEVALDEARDASLVLKRIVLEAAVGICSASAVYGDAESDSDQRAAVRGLEIAEELGDLEQQANLLSAFGMVTMNDSDDRFAEGLARVEKSVEVARASGSQLALFRSVRGLVFGYMLDGRDGEARALSDDMIAAFDRSGDATRNTEPYMGARFFRGRYLLDYDYYDESGPWLLETFERAERAGNRTMKSAAASMLAALAFFRGEYDDAEKWASIALPVAEAIDSLAAIRSSTATLLLVRAQRGSPGVTAAEFERIDRGLLASGDLGTGFEWIVEALLENGETARARRLAEGRAARAGGRMRVARAALASGQVALFSGPDEYPVAERHFQHALARGKAIGLRSVQGRAQLGLAAIARAQGRKDAANGHARQAVTILRAIGMNHYAARAAGLLLDRLEESSPNA
jgi:class 3 adenylate cyclase